MNEKEMEEYKLQTITADDLQKVLNAKFNNSIIEQCQSSDLTYRNITPAERDSYINDTINILFDELTVAGPKRIAQWETGWEQNLTEFKKTRCTDSLIPKYHSKYKYLHWKQSIIHPLNPKFDYNIHCIIVDWLFSNYLSDVNTIYEFGCGPAYHLLRARHFNRNASLIGLDWTTTSQEIITEIKKSNIENNIEGYKFDFYNPDYNIDIKNNGGIITIAALEQVGPNFKEFVSYLLAKKPKICVHLEPIDDLMDTSNIIDNLSVLYCRKRNYLNGFLPYLQTLQDEGKIKIINQQRTFTGSQYIEGHSLIVWEPV